MWFRVQFGHIIVNPANHRVLAGGHLMQLRILEHEIALRAGGILQMLDGSKVGEDPEYRAFVAKTEFDYKQDLDTAMVAFGPTGRYMLLKGVDMKSIVTVGFGDTQPKSTKAQSRRVEIVVVTD